jgi:hypothetical protein
VGAINGAPENSVQIDTVDIGALAKINCAPYKHPVRML